MTHAQTTAVRKAKARQAAADVVEKLGAEDSEHVQLVKNYREAGVLTGRNTEDALDTLVAALAEIVEDSLSKQSAKPTTKKKS
jgi:hypothetical protein